MKNALTRNLRIRLLIVALSSLGVISSACSSPNPQPAALTPVPTLAPAATPTLITALQVAAGGAAVPPAGAPGDPALGAPIFLQNCSPCHGRDGEGANAPTLRNDLFIQSGGQGVFQTIANGRPGTGMPGGL
jgi:mono/diheme cytochrome c family protein